MKHIINEMIAEYHQETREAYKKLSNDVLEGLSVSARNTASTIKTLQTSIDTLEALLVRIENEEGTA